MTAHPIFTQDDLASLRLWNPLNARDTVRKMAGDAAREAGTTAALVLGPEQNKRLRLVRDVVIYRAAEIGIDQAVIGKAMGLDRSTICRSLQREKERRGIAE